MLKQLFARIPTTRSSCWINGSLKSQQFKSTILQQHSTSKYFLGTFVLNQRFLSDRRFSEKHEWLVLDKNDKSIGTVGISHYAQDALGDVVYVQLPDIDREVKKDEEVGAIESVKSANELFTPVDGHILEVNKTLEEKPGLINKSCYDEGWLFKIKIKDLKQVDEMMDEEAYENFLKTVQI